MLHDTMSGQNEFCLIHDATIVLPHSYGPESGGNILKFLPNRE